MSAIELMLEALKDANAKMVDIDYRATIDGIDRGKVLAAIAAGEAELAREPEVWRDHDNTGMSYPEGNDLIGGATDCAREEIK